MAHYSLIAGINARNGKFPFVNVQFTKGHRLVGRFTAGELVETSHAPRSG